MSNTLNSYTLSRQWFDFCFENPEKADPKHTAIYFFAIEHCNRLGWKEKFGFPSQMAMEAVGIRSWKTYHEAFTDIVQWGFFELIEKSRNQYSSNIIRLCNNSRSTSQSDAEAPSRALDKALSKHNQEHNSPAADVISEEPNDGLQTTIESRVKGCPVPEELQIEGFVDRYREYWDHMEENYQKRASITVVQANFRRLIELKREGNDPLKVIDQTINATNKSFYELKDKQFNDKENSEQPVDKAKRHLSQTERIFADDVETAVH